MTEELTLVVFMVPAWQVQDVTVTDMLFESARRSYLTVLEVWCNLQYPRLKRDSLEFFISLFYYFL